jgi:proline iminopeptidase
VDQDLSLPSITVNGAMLHSEAFGHPDSTMIVCIHGGPGSDYRYLLNCKDLVDHGYRVIFYDQRGSGLSQRFSKDYYTDLGTGALDVLYDELSGVIDHYRTSPDQKVFLIGHSWGAMLATAYTGRHPDAIQALVVCEPGGLKWDDVKEFVSESRSFGLFGEILNNATYMDQFITGKENEHEILDYKAALLASKNDITGDDNTEPGSTWRSGAVINSALFEIGEDYRPDFSEGISNFTEQVLFFYSENNKAYPDSWAQKISASYLSADLHKIMGVGHDGIIKDKAAWTDQTLPVILDYFNGK